MRKIILFAASGRGKQIIKKYGNEWLVVKSQPVVIFTKQIGPWLFCEPNIKLKNDAINGQRWIHLKNDKHFKVEETDDEICGLAKNSNI